MIDIIIPVTGRDIERLSVLCLSLEKFRKFDGAIIFICPTYDKQRVMQSIAQFDLQSTVVLGDNNVIDGIETHHVGGWFKQQVLKLAAHKFVKSDYYLTMDADCIMCMKIHENDLIKDGKSIVDVYSKNFQPDWYAVAAEYLGVTPPQNSTNVTPFVFSKHVVELLERRLEGVFLGKPDVWLSLLDDAHRKSWSEYSLYHTFVYALGYFDKFHFKSEGILTQGNCVWFKEDLSNWKPEECFNGKWYFSLIQSNTGVSPEWVAERITPYLR